MTAAQLSRRTMMLAGAASVYRGVSPACLHADGFHFPRTIFLTADNRVIGTLPKTTGLTIVDDRFSGRGLDERVWERSFPDHVRDQLSLHQAQWFANPQVHVNQGLTLTAQRASGLPDGLCWNSGAVTTRHPFGPYAHIKVTALLPTGAGLWPEMCLFSPTQWPPEIDLLEVIHPQPNTVHDTFHWSDTAGDQQAGGGSTVNVAVWHTYELWWLPRLIVWFIDGVPTFAVTDTTAPIADIPLGLTIGLAVGGTGAWGGTWDATTPSPSVMRIGSVLIEGVAAT